MTPTPIAQRLTVGAAVSGSVDGNRKTDSVDQASRLRCRSTVRTSATAGEAHVLLIEIP